jgi:hypothetical protein
VNGRYTDILIKEGGRWQLIGWAGGTTPRRTEPPAAAGGPGARYGNRVATSTSGDTCATVIA